MGLWRCSRVAVSPGDICAGRWVREDWSLVQSAVDGSCCRRVAGRDDWPLQRALALDGTNVQPRQQPVLARWRCPQAA